MLERIGRPLAVVAAATMAVVTVAATATPAMAGDRPTGVAFVRTWHRAYLHRDGSVTVGAGLRCVPGWSSAELDVHLVQGTTYGDGYIVAAVPCNGAWHPATVTIDDFSGPIHLGAISTSSQFLVTNDASGDSAGAHQTQRRGVLVCRWCTS